MNGRAFIDTNIILYLYSNEEDKRDIALDILSNHMSFISFQVINEFINVAKKKLKRSQREILIAVDEIMAACLLIDFSRDIIEKAVQISERFKFSYYDSRIISSGLRAECPVLYTEDLQHNQIIENRIKIINPFQN